MRVTYLGHAGFLLRNARGFHLLMDPWLSASGAFLRSWFQFPENHFLADSVERLDPWSTALYVSHHHRDHFDREFLLRLDPRTPVVVARYVRRHFVHELADLGFRDIREVEHGESVEIGGFSLRLFIDESYSNEDSGILAEADGACFLNMNDCRAHDTLPVAELEGVDLFTMQFSGASGYPSAYDYDGETKDELACRKNARKFESVLQVIRDLRPRLYVPSAGPPCFLDAPLRAHNEGRPSSFPDASEFLPLVASEGCPSSFVFPGDTIELDPDRKPAAERSGRFDEQLYTRKSEVLDDYARRFETRARIPASDRSRADELAARFEEKLSALRQPLEVEHAILVTVTGIPGGADARFEIDLRERTLSRDVTPAPDSPRYHYRIANDVAGEFLATGALWDDLVLSLRYTVSRQPDEFDVVISDFMRLEASDLRGYPPKAPEVERATIRGSDGTVHEFDRWCPHQGGDLSRGRLDGGCLVCPRHGWSFDLKRGGACHENRATINSRPIS